MRPSEVGTSVARNMAQAEKTGDGRDSARQALPDAVVRRVKAEARIRQGRISSQNSQSSSAAIAGISKERGRLVMLLM